jgi:hypothetical protein
VIIEPEMKYGLNGSIQWNEVAKLLVPAIIARAGVIQHIEALNAVNTLKAICVFI